MYFCCEIRQICKRFQDHCPVCPPKPYPVEVTAVLDLKDVLEINANKKTMTVLTNIILTWKDEGISVFVPNNTT